MISINLRDTEMKKKNHCLYANTRIIVTEGYGMGYISREKKKEETEIGTIYI
jgi:hypothetical protein